MKNDKLKLRILTYILIFSILTFLPNIIIPFLDLEQTSSNFVIYFMIIMGVNFGIVNMIYFVESKNNREINIFKPLSINFFMAAGMGLISSFGINNYVGSPTSEKTTALIISCIISIIPIFIFVFVVKLVLLMTSKGDKYKEMLVRKIYFLIINNLKWEEKDEFLLFKNKKDVLAVNLIDPETKPNSIQFEFEKEIINKKENINDLFEEVSNKPVEKEIVKDDILASKIRKYSLQFNKVAFFYESESNIPLIGLKPKNVIISNFNYFNTEITTFFKNKSK